MILVGLTGGIGSGKSTVSELLVARGAVLIDADAITKELQQPGMPVVVALGERFGPGVITADGALDRAALAAIAFTDAESLKALNEIVHPAVRAEIARRAALHNDFDGVVVLDVPLLVEGRGRYNVSGVIVVDVPEDVAVQRLVAFRGFSEADARARMSRQVSREERRAAADRIIDNSGDLASLEAQVDAVWEWVLTLPPFELPTPKPSG